VFIGLVKGNAKELGMFNLTEERKEVAYKCLKWINFFISLGSLLAYLFSYRYRKYAKHVSLAMGFSNYLLQLIKPQRLENEEKVKFYQTRQIVKGWFARDKNKELEAEIAAILGGMYK
jgi:NADPH-dependent 7-cyano-7-deazaguanine reductase QueF